MKIESVSLFSTSDLRFIDVFISQNLKCVDKVHIATFSHFWDGTPENLLLLDQQYKKYSSDRVVFHPIKWQNGQPFYWESLGRVVGTQAVADDSDYIMYIDIDEIPDDIIFNNIKNGFSDDTIRLTNYWYFRDATNQALQTETSVVLCKTNIAKHIPHTPIGRQVYFEHIHSNKITIYTKPCIHHYSWVHSKQEMLTKTKSWGHRNDKKWAQLIEEEFSREFNGTDFVHGYRYKKVENRWNV